MILKNNGVASKTTKEKVKSLALKAKITREQTSDDSDNQGGSDEEEEAEEFNLMVRNFCKFFRKDNRFGSGNWFGNGGNRFRKGCGNGFGNKGGRSSRQKHKCFNYGEEGHFIEKHAFENEHSKLFSKINELELEVKKLTKSKEVVEPCQMCEILTQEVDSLKSNAFKLQDEALNFSKLKKSRVVLDDMLNRASRIGKHDAIDATIVVGGIGPYLGRAARGRACSHGGSHTLFSRPALANLSSTLSTEIQHIQRLPKYNYQKRVQSEQCITKNAEAKHKKHSGYGPINEHDGVLFHRGDNQPWRCRAAWQAWQLTQEVSKQTSFVPTIATWTGSYKSMKAWLLKPQSSRTKNPELGQEFPFDHGGGTIVLTLEMEALLLADLALLFKRYVKTIAWADPVIRRQ
ncbi:hypothetical protein Tco_1211582 [Tanacetum coccineum]